MILTNPDGISTPVRAWDCSALLLPPTRWAGIITALVSVNHAGGDCCLHVRFIRFECHRDDSQSRGTVSSNMIYSGCAPCRCYWNAKAENCEIRMTIYNLLHGCSCCLHEATMCFHCKHHGSIRTHRGSVREVDLDGTSRIA